MLAFRCPDCGDTRWSPLGITASDDPPECEICGAEMVRERRMPGTLLGTEPLDERRETVVHLTTV